LEAVLGPVAVDGQIMADPVEPGAKMAGPEAGEIPDGPEPGFLEEILRTAPPSSPISPA